MLPKADVPAGPTGFIESLSKEHISKYDCSPAELFALCFFKSLSAHPRLKQHVELPMKMPFNDAKPLMRKHRQKDSQLPKAPFLNSEIPPGVFGHIDLIEWEVSRPGSCVFHSPDISYIYSRETTGRKREGLESKLLIFCVSS